jgi:N-acetylglucosaminyl-diphospho-decaprenol L-rhamnosyltransferase
MSESKLQAPDVSVSIVSYNTRDLLRDCLASLRQRAAEGEVTLEVIVADNGSTDGSVEMVQSEFPEFIVFRTGGNIGYGRANNAAFLRSRGRYFFVLNSDTEVEPGALRAMRDFMDSAPQAGGAGAKLILPDGSTQPSVGLDPSLRAVFFEQTYLDKLLPKSKLTGGYLLTWWDYKERREVKQVCGACLFVRREAWLQIGGFDAAFFMYFEDTDFCVRLRRAGWQIWYLPEARIQHRLGGSSAADWRVRARMISSYNQSRYYFWAREGGRGAALFIKTMTLLGATLRLLAWTGKLLQTPRDSEARRQQKLFRRVCRATARMKPCPEGPPFTAAEKIPTSNKP